MSDKMEEYVKKILEDHRNPVVRLETVGQKLFHKAATNEGKELTEKNLNNLQKTFAHSRVERRCARAQAEWCEQKKMAIVIKVIKSLVHSYGYQDKTGIYLYPEEMLYLVESNRLEVFHCGKSLTLQNCYDIVMNDLNCGLKNYMVYKKLVVQGYRVARQCEILRREASSQEKMYASKKPECKKRKLVEIPSKEKERPECYRANESNSREISEKIGQNAPTQSVPNDIPEFNYDYAIFLPSNKSRIEFDYILIICCNELLLDKMIHLERKPIIYAVCEDNITFHRISNVCLPIL